MPARAIAARVREMKDQRLGIGRASVYRVLDASH
jgi:hypothetical protein